MRFLLLLLFSAYGSVLAVARLRFDSSLTEDKPTHVSGTLQDLRKESCFSRTTKSFSLAETGSR